ncbi:MAG TPA: amidohydrolase family protein [Blastocatellia bacterium]|nr:amidohydrolase family protein [Blastocatellia bacterium]
MVNSQPSHRSLNRPRVSSRPATLLVALALAASMLFSAARPHTARGFAPDAYAIKDAQIITGTGKTIAKGTVVFRNGLITEVGENAKIPGDARVIEGAGLTVYPGLIDAMSSLGLQTQQPQQAAGRGQGQGRQQAAVAALAAGAQPNPDAAHGDPSLTAADQVKPDAPGIEDARNAGFTAALSSPRQGIFPGQSAVISLAADEASQMVVRAPVALTVQFTPAGGFFSQYPNSLMGTVAFVRQTFYDAMHYRDEMDRYNRVKRGVERPSYDKKLAALQTALRGELPVMFVANSEGDIRRSLMVAREFNLKPIIAGALYGYRVIDMLKAANVPVILSVDYPRRPVDLPEDEDESLRILRNRAETPKGAARLAAAGIKFAFASGTQRPADFIANVQRAIESGLSKDEALRALTINAAEILGTSEQLGSVEVGKIANLVVTSGDLLARDAKLRYVFIDGKEIELKKPEAPAGRPGGGRPGGAPGGAPGGVAGGVAAVDPAGEWSLQVATPQGDTQVRLSLRRDGGQLLGTLNAPQGTYEIRDAKLTGNELRFSASIQIQSDTVNALFVGTIEGNSMRGTVTIPSIGTFDFSGTRPR